MSVGLLGCCPAAVWKLQKPAKAPGHWERCFEHPPVRPTLDLKGKGAGDGEGNRYPGVTCSCSWRGATPMGCYGAFISIHSIRPLAEGRGSIEAKVSQGEIYVVILHGNVAVLTPTICMATSWNSLTGH